MTVRQALGDFRESERRRREYYRRLERILYTTP
jgi:hypothetical protein